MNNGIRFSWDSWCLPGETGADGMKGDAGRSGKLGPEGLPGQKGDFG